MKKLPHIVLGLSLGLTSVLSAQTSDTPASPGTGSGRGHSGPGRAFHPFMRALDTDKDGELSTTEIANAPASLRALDANGDGSVTREDLQALRSAKAPERPAKAQSGEPGRRGGSTERVRSEPPVMLALDADKDGALAAAEIANATASLNALDANKDGKLTRDELRPEMPATK